MGHIPVLIQYFTLSIITYTPEQIGSSNNSPYLVPFKPPPPVNKMADTASTQLPQEREQFLNLFVAIHQQGVRCNHWSLFIDGPSADMKVHHEIISSNRKLHWEYRMSNDPHDYSHEFEVIFLHRVSAAHFDRIKSIAENMYLSGYRREWDSQTYVLDLMEELENGGVIVVPPEQDDGYDQRVKYIIGRRQWYRCLPRIVRWIALGCLWDAVGSFHIYGLLMCRWNDWRKGNDKVSTFIGINYCIGFGCGFTGH